MRNSPSDLRGGTLPTLSLEAFANKLLNMKNLFVICMEIHKKGIRLPVFGGHTMLANVPF